MTQQRWRSNRARIMTIAPDTIFHFITFLYFILPSTPSTKPQNELPSAPADSERNRRGDGEIFYAYELPTHTQKTASRTIFTRIALHRRSVLCFSPSYPKMSQQFFTALFFDIRESADEEG
ncbi:hypothetical protein VC83_01671 [Pseudogymnoascus destructans]|uniref:Uncharacterized protein n=1 Tax=Pseudogymnoascus destructans TaxID=655981 RepID=A0A177AJY4_9PEZI|nr:uncharacterized protein VC83_01671 [Pseudogymnoascus destructans]OAF62100.1 hypothetical protein VC83_01671 [Pseudogymnoascus destructans]